MYPEDTKVNYGKNVLEFSYVTLADSALASLLNLLMVRDQ